MAVETQPDRTSRVPKYTFAETLEEQEAQLKTNPLMQRLIEYRRSYEGDPHRPIYHYINPEHTLNDPNGLCFWQDRQTVVFLYPYPAIYLLQIPLLKDQVIQGSFLLPLNHQE